MRPFSASADERLDRVMASTRTQAVILHDLAANVAQLGELIGRLADIQGETCERLAEYVEAEDASV